MTFRLRRWKIPSGWKTMHSFFRRVRFLSNRRVQFRLASVFLMWLLAFLSIFGFIFYMNFAMFSERTAAMNIHDQLLTKLLLVEQSKTLALWYGLAILAYIFLMFSYVLVYSHRLTGPIDKITKIFEKAAESGEFPKKIILRKSDSFTELADAINKFIEKKLH